MMIAVQVVIWSWVPISLAAVATQATGHDTGSLGQFLVPGSAAASIIACVWLFLQRMAKAGEENKMQIQIIVDAHERAIKVLSESIGRNTDGMRFLTEKVINECHNPKKNNEGQ